MSSDESAENGLLQRQNYMKLQHLIHTTATRCLRQMFIFEWSQRSKPSEWSNDEASGREFIANEGRNVYRQSHLPQQGLLQLGNVDHWDVPLLVKAIKAISSSSPAFSTSDRNKGLDILVKQRNILSHHGSTHVTEDQFQLIWNPVCQTLLKFGVPEASILDSNIQNLVGTESTNPNIGAAQTLRDEGNKFFQEGDFTKAIEKYTEAISLQDLPTLTVAALYSNRSVSNLKIRDLRSAKSDARGAILMQPGWSKGYFRLAAAYEALKKPQQASKNYELSVALETIGIKRLELKGSLYNCRYRTVTDNFVKKDYNNHVPIPFHDIIINFVLVLRKGFNATAYGLPDLKNLNLSGENPLRLAAEGSLLLHSPEKTLQNLQKAAQLFMKAKDNAEALYNLAILTMQGDGGMEQNFEKGIENLVQAAQKNNIIEACGRKLPNVGVAESMHFLGLCYAEGIGVDRNLSTAISWYKKAIRNGSGASCVNLFLIYNLGHYPAQKKNVEMEIALLKLGVFYRSSIALERLVATFERLQRSAEAWKWFDYAVAEGGTDLNQRKNMLLQSLGPNPNPHQGGQSWGQLKSDISGSPSIVKDLICSDEPILALLSAASSLQEAEPSTSDQQNRFKTGLILEHRQKKAQAIEIRATMPYISTLSFATEIVQPSLTDLLGLRQISLAEMDGGSDKPYEGFVLKLTIIEEPILGYPSIPMIGEDENKDVQIVAIYNHDWTNDAILEKFAFGSKLSIVNPLFRISNSGPTAIRVDDPGTVFFHPTLSDGNRCRFCEKQSKPDVKCRKCRIWQYCSKKCLRSDAKLWKHDLICCQNQK